jgi:hypothetical protein
VWGLASWREALVVARAAPRLSSSSTPAMVMVMVQTIRFLPVRSLSLRVPINPPDIPVIWADVSPSSHPRHLKRSRPFWVIRRRDVRTGGGVAVVGVVAGVGWCVDRGAVLI